MHQNQKVIQFLLDNMTQFACHLSIQVVSPVSNFSNPGISGIISIGSGPIQPWIWVMNQISDPLKLSEHTWCGSWPKIIRPENFRCQLSCRSILYEMLTWWSRQVSMPSVCLNLTGQESHLQGARSSAGARIDMMLRSNFGVLTRFEFQTVLQVSFSFHPMVSASLVVIAGAALLGRSFAVLLQYQGYWTSRPALLFGLWWQWQSFSSWLIFVVLIELWPP